MNNHHRHLGRYDSFDAFISHDQHFSPAEQTHILKSFQDPMNQRVVKLSLILAVWSIIGAFIDSALIGGGIVVSAMMGPSLMYFIPELTFFTLNMVAKVFFVRWYLARSLSFGRLVLSGVPYLGSILVIGFLTKDDPVFFRGLRHFLRYQRGRGIRNLGRILRMNILK